jgi:MFS family permease
MIGTLTAFCLFLIGPAAAENIGKPSSPEFRRQCLTFLAILVSQGTVLVCRFFAGIFASAMQSLGPAIVSDLFSPREIAVPLTCAAIGSIPLFTFFSHNLLRSFSAPFLGPSLGPLIGNFVTQYSGSWRNINYISMALAGFLAVTSLIVKFFFVFLSRHRLTVLEMFSVFIDTGSGDLCCDHSPQACQEAHQGNWDSPRYSSGSRQCYLCVAPGQKIYGSTFPVHALRVRSQRREGSRESYAPNRFLLLGLSFSSYLFIVSIPQECWCH